MIPAPKAIIFDWDNTLADTWPTIHLALEETFIAMGKTPWTFEQTKERVHRSMRDSFPDIFGEKWEEAGKIYQQSFRSHHIAKLTPLPKAVDVLKLLKPKKIFVAVVSNKLGDSLRKEITHLNWDQYFQSIVGADDAAASKPAADPVHLALKNTNIPLGKDIWFIGDSVTDMECAHLTGCFPLFYGDANPKDERFQHCPPEHHVHNHHELIELINTVIV